MQIPYEVAPRPDTGLYNAKLGIWLFLASEVMLFGGLFSAYIFERLGAEPGYWPRGLLNVPVGTFNTAVLIASSVTVVLAWASLKMRQYDKYKIYMALTIAAGALFLIVKLAYEYPQKFDHFGVILKKEAWPKYEQYLGNKHLADKKLPPRIEISGHLLDAPKGSPYEAAAKKNADKHAHHAEHTETGAVQGGHGGSEGVQTENPDDYVIAMDPVNADPARNDRPHFLYESATNHTVSIDKADVQSASMFTPQHNNYFATYFMITGLHGAHVLAGVIVFCYMLFFGLDLYRRNPEHLANRVEVAGLFWHFVDLIWIFVFPLFYLL
jgi:cytochrome c oxidase subunit 3